MPKKLGRYRDDDVELCRTTNRRASSETVQALLEERIPFTKNHKKIPFYQREQYQGASELWVISTSPRRYGQARRVIDAMERFYRDRLVLSNY